MADRYKVITFQLPLSGSLVFRLYDTGTTAGAIILSTPSLGITSRGGFDYYDPVEKNFQLPLSGSRSHQVGGRKGPHHVPFNSLSRDHSITAERRRRSRKCVLSTPSLGITLTVLVLEQSNRMRLSTPSLGITGFSQLEWMGVDHTMLSTPSLGITRRLWLPERSPL